MNIEQLRSYCLTKAHVEECLPFGPDTLVFKVAGKAFLLVGLDAISLQFNVKCDPEKAQALREQYSCIVPGYHMNKKHWNTVIVDGTLTFKQLTEHIDHSYDIIWAALSKSVKNKLTKH